jgi:aspartate/glutamate/glutamine transport system permease protein
VLVSDYFGRAVVDNLPLLLEGYRTTVIVSLLAMLLSLALGILVAGLRTSGVAPLRWLAVGYVEFFRNTPLLIQLYFYFFGLTRLGVRLSAFEAGVAALGIYTGAYVAEVIRAGILAVDRGQTEAAHALGLSNFQSLRLVILPQAVRTVLPPLGNLGIALIKNSALVGSIALADLLHVADLVQSRTFRTFEVFTAVILFYLSLTLPLAWLVSRLERRLAVLR